MTDWSVLGRSDPAPGDVAGTRELGQNLLQRAGQVEEQTGHLRALADNAGALQMAGDYASSYMEALSELPGDLGKLGTAFRGAGSALMAFADRLLEAKIRAGVALRDGEDADVRYRSAVRDLRLLLPAAQQNLIGNGLSLSPSAIEAATVSLDANTREQIRSAAGRARTADVDLDRARSLADQAAALRGEAEDTCVQQINHALDSSGIRNKSWLSKAWHAATTPFRSWDNFVSFCGKVALVAGIAALIISGPIGIALGVLAALAGGAIFADGLMKYSAGEIGLGELALDGLGAIPGGGDVGALARMGEEASAMGRVVEDAGRSRTLFRSGGWTGAGFAERSSGAEEQAYLEIRTTDDVDDIATRTGLSVDMISRVKQHLFMEEHDIPAGPNNVVHAHFTPSAYIADLWKGAASGTLSVQGQASFRALVAHEYVESRLMETGMPYRSAHPEAYEPDGYAVFNPEHFGAHEVAPRSSDGDLRHWKRLGIVQPDEALRPDLKNIDSLVEAALRQLDGGR